MNQHHHSLATLIPAFYPSGSPCVFTSHPKRVARPDPNRRQVLMRDTERERWIDRRGERNCSTLPASCHGRDGTAFFPFPPLSFSLSHRHLMSDLKLLSSFPPFLSVRREGARVGRVSCCCFGTRLLCDVAGFLKEDQREKCFSDLSQMQVTLPLGTRKMYWRYGAPCILYRCIVSVLLM